MGTTVQTVKLEQGLLIRLKIHAARTGATQQDILHASLLKYLNEHESLETSEARLPVQPSEAVDIEPQAAQEDTNLVGAEGWIMQQLDFLKNDARETGAAQAKTLNGHTVTFEKNKFYIEGHGKMRQSEIPIWIIDHMDTHTQAAYDALFNPAR